MSAGPSAVTVNPFPGLRPFREDEQRLFFGREAQVDRMIDKLAVNRFLAVVGTSGSGKSSLVNCGFKPALRRGLLTSAGSAWRMVQFRPGANPTRALADALLQDGSLIPSVGAKAPRADLIEATLGLSGLGLVDIYKQARLSLETNLLVVVDQFEELFRYRSLSSGPGFGYGPEAIRFVRLLLDSARQKDVPLYIVLTMRSDFLGDCAQFDGLPEAISEGQYLVPRMTRDERRAAIEGPIRWADCTISTALLTQLVNDVGDNPDQLSILQHAMNRTWAHWRHDRSGQGPITADDYVAVGTMTKALDGHAEKAFKELSQGRQQAICERVFKALTDRGTDPRGIRRPTKLANLCEIAGASEAEVTDVIRVFRKSSRSFLMPSESENIDGQCVIDISHESLMRVWERLNTWADQEAEAAREYRRLSDRAEGHSKNQVGLMQDPDLQTTLDFHARQQPTPAWADLYGGKFEQSIEFLRKSEERRLQERADRELDRRWQLRWQPVLFGVAALAFLIVLLNYRSTLLPPAIPQGNPKRELSAWLRDFATYFPRVGGVTLAFALVYGGVLRVGRGLHRKLALPAIVNAIRNPVKVAPVVKLRVQDPAAAAGTTYARGWRRGLAFVIDALVGLLIFALAGAPYWISQNDNLIWLSYVGWPLGVGVYHVITEGSGMQASFGMRAVRTYVTDLDGTRLSRWGAIKRQLAKFAWYALVLFLLAMSIGDLLVLPVGLLLMAGLYFAAKWRFPNSPIIRRRQWPADILSKTVVLVGRPVKVLPG